MNDLRLAVGALAVHLSDAVAAQREERTVHAAELKRRDAVASDVAEAILALSGQIAELRGHVAPKAVPAPTSWDAVSSIIAPFGRLPLRAVVGLVLIAFFAAVSAPAVIVAVLEHERIVAQLFGGTP